MFVKFDSNNKKGEVSYGLEGVLTYRIVSHNECDFPINESSKEWKDRLIAELSDYKAPNCTGVVDIATLETNMKVSLIGMLLEKSEGKLYYGEDTLDYILKQILLDKPFTFTVLTLYCGNEGSATFLVGPGDYVGICDNNYKLIKTINAPKLETEVATKLDLEKIFQIINEKDLTKPE